MNDNIKTGLLSANAGEIVYHVEYFNLDVIISVGYRVKSKRGTKFRQWANPILKNYLLKGYAINQRIERIENFAIETERRITQAETKIDILIHHVENKSKSNEYL